MGKSAQARKGGTLKADPILVARDAVMQELKMQLGMESLTREQQRTLLERLEQDMHDRLEQMDNSEQEES